MKLEKNTLKKKKGREGWWRQYKVASGVIRIEQGMPRKSLCTEHIYTFGRK